MKISIVLSTYNGGAYIIEQLDSILNQTRKADEVLIFDDCSTDNTQQIIEQFISEHNLTTWKFAVNHENKGWKRNFMEGIWNTLGDLVFPCDQDDIWMPKKLEQMEKIMIENPKIMVLTSNYESFYDSGKRVCGPEKDDGKLIKQPLSNKVFNIRYPGCTYCIRREFVEISKKHWQVDFPHDALFWRMGMFSDSLYSYNVSLIQWRKHTDSTFRIKVIHQVNRGCSAARNEGLSHAKGEYIGIIDQDDYLHEKYIEYFMKLMLDHNAEIATTDTILSFIGDAPVSTNLDFNKYSILSGEDAAKAMLMYTLQIGPWNKLIKKSLIEREGISFQEQFYCGEGFAFSVECFQSTNKVVVGHQNVYFYRIDNATSGSSTFSLGKYNSSVNAQDYMRNVLKDKSQYADNVLKFSKWRTLSDNFTLLKASGEEKEYSAIYRELKHEVKKGALNAFKIPVKPKQKLRAFVFGVSPEAAASIFSGYLNRKMGGKFKKNTENKVDIQD